MRADVARTDDRMPPDLDARDAASVSVATLMSRGVSVEWYEGVALIQGICAALMSEGASGTPGVPEPDAIALMPEGHLEFVGPAPRDQSPILRLANLMAAIVPLEALPTPLREHVLRALSASPPIGTVSEFSRMLDYYERPNRRELLQGLYLKGRPETGVVAQTHKRVPVLPLRPTPRPARPPRRPRLAFAVFGVLTTLALLAGAWALTAPPRERLGAVWNSLVSDVVDASRAVGRGVMSGLAAVEARLQSTPAPSATAPAGSRPSASQVVHAGVGRLPSLGRPEALPSKPVRVIGDHDVLVPPAPTMANVPMEPREDTEAAISAAPVPPLDDNIYSSESGGVSQAVLMWPPVRHEPPARHRIEEYPEVEVVVSPMGTVESVRRRPSAVGVKDSMMLSAVKAWRFLPAVKDGHPVRFRFVVRLISE